LELQVSLILLGIALAGLVPLVVIQSKQLKALEHRWNPDWTASEAEADFWIDPYRATPDGPVYDLVPADVQDCAEANPWARKLGASARLVPRAESDSPVSSVTGGWAPGVAQNTVVISGGTVSTGTTNASAAVEVTPISPTP
jgi:hypothetical protein